jgi:hypothetical protein
VLSHETRTVRASCRMLDAFRGALRALKAPGNL